MKVFLTGASGFLGKRVLSLLVSDPRIERIDVVSRRKRTYPDPKVRTHQFDLAEPWGSQPFLEDTDAVIHLAGLYDFTKPYSTDYQQNVFPVLHLIDRIRERKSGRAPQILMASTYAVGFGSEGAFKEGPLTSLPPYHVAYARTKAVAEKALTDSGLAARIFRIGVLVGDTSKGELEKIDGPYYIMRFLKRLSQSAYTKSIAANLKKFPFPYSPDAIIPLVPVDCAAKVIHQALFLDPLKEGQQEYYGLFNPKSVSMEEFAHRMVREFLPAATPVGIQKKTPRWLERLQYPITGIPKEILEFSHLPIELSNENFLKTFGPECVPHFDDYRETFFKGFQQCLEK